MPGLYLAAICVSAACMVLIDRRWRLYLFADWRRALAVQAAGVGLFLVWDLVCIQLGIFMRGPGPWQVGWQLAPELPVEEVFFLWFLCHFTMVLFTGIERLLAWRSGRSAATAPEGASGGGWR